MIGEEEEGDDDDDQHQQNHSHPHLLVNQSNHCEDDTTPHKKIDGFLRICSHATK